VYRHPPQIILCLRRLGIESEQDAHGLPRRTTLTSNVTRRPLETRLFHPYTLGIRTCDRLYRIPGSVQSARLMEGEYVRFVFTVEETDTACPYSGRGRMMFADRYYRRPIFLDYGVRQVGVAPDVGEVHDGFCWVLFMVLFSFFPSFFFRRWLLPAPVFFRSPGFLVDVRRRFVAFAKS